MGENGAGKTTLLSCILGAISFEEGTVSVQDKDSKDGAFHLVKHEIGVVWDDAGFPEMFYVKEVNACMKHAYKNWDESEFFRYVKQFNIPTKTKMSDMSRGTKVKLSLAVALSHKAKLLILDEPTSGLDPMVRDEILEIFNDFTRDENNTVLLSSHIVSDLEKICDYVAFIHRGKLRFFEEKDALIEKYALIKVTEAQYDTIYSGIVAQRKTSFGREALALREELPSDIKTEHTTLEDIVLMMAKS